MDHVLTCLKKKTPLSILTKIIIKHLLTGPKENREFCSPEIPPQGKVERNIESIEG